MSTRIDYAKVEKIASKVFTCKASDVGKRSAELNKLLDEGWLVEKTEVVEGTYVVVLKQDCPSPRVVYVDVTGMDPQSAHEAVLHVKQTLKDRDGEDVFIPVWK